MFTNVNPLTHRKIEKAFTPMYGQQDYTVMHAHSVRPPHMLGIQPHVYAAVSRERISHTRARGSIDDSQDQPQALDPALYLVEELLEGSPGLALTPEQAMEVDAARALEELAVAGRMTTIETWHGPPQKVHASQLEEDLPIAHDTLSPPPPPNLLSSSVTPLSPRGSVDQSSEGDSSADEGPARSERGSRPLGDTAFSSSRPSNYYRDPLARPSPTLRAPRSKKRTSGVPIPVPHLTKPSRGRRVPVAEIDTDVTMLPSGGPNSPVVGNPVASPSTSRSGTTSPYGTRSSRGVKAHGGDSKLTAADVAAKIGASGRAYVCKVEGCGKAFRRGEHLKRHVRSLHTHEKPERCTFPGCGKEFSRKDNMQQHLKIHAHNRNSVVSPSKKHPRSGSAAENDDEDDDDDAE